MVPEEAYAQCLSFARSDGTSTNFGAPIGTTMATLACVVALSPIPLDLLQIGF